MPPPTLKYSQRLAVHPAQYLAQVKKSDVKATLKEMWVMPYPADPILEPEYEGLTYGQVILMQQTKAAAVGGSIESANFLLDRMIGKPEQVNKNLNLGGSYKEFLEDVAKQEGLIDAEGRVIEATDAEIVE